MCEVKLGVLNDSELIGIMYLSIKSFTGWKITSTTTNTTTITTIIPPPPPSPLSRTPPIYHTTPPNQCYVPSLSILQVVCSTSLPSVFIQMSIFLILPCSMGVCLFVDVSVCLSVCQFVSVSLSSFWLSAFV